MKDIIIVLIIAIVVGLAALYIFKAKKKGQKCIGCPYCDSCAHKSCPSDTKGK